MSSNGIKDRVAIVGMSCTPFREHFSRSRDDLLIDAADDIGIRIVGNPKQQSCPAGSSEQTSHTDGRISFDPDDTTLENWSQESEPSGRISPENSSCPEGYKPINHLSAVGGYVRHVDCIPVAMGQAH